MITMTLLAFMWAFSHFVTTFVMELVERILFQNLKKFQAMHFCMEEEYCNLPVLKQLCSSQKNGVISKLEEN